MNFNKFNKKLAASCTNPDYIVAVPVKKITDPVTKQDSYEIEGGYDKDVQDDCSYTAPTVSASRSGNKISVSVTGSSIIKGKYSVSVNGAGVESGTINSTSFTPSYAIPLGNTEDLNIVITVTDTAYGSSASTQITVPAQKKPSSDSGS